MNNKQTPWDYRYSQRTQRMKGSAIRELLKITEQPDIISFGGGLPAPDVFPVEEFKRACIQVLEHNSSIALQYGSTEGYTPLREMIAGIPRTWASMSTLKISSSLPAPNKPSTCSVRSSSTAATVSWWSRQPTWERCRPGMPTERNTSLCPWTNME